MLFDPKKSFFQLPIVWWTMATIGAASLVSTLIIGCNTTSSWDLSFRGFNQFILMFRFPLGLLALAIPIVALLAANHRSVQTGAQIVAAESQNNFANHYKHLEEFGKYADQILDSSTISQIGVNPLYLKLYPRSKSGEFVVDADIQDRVVACFAEIEQSLRKISKKGGEVAKEQLYAIDSVFKRKLPSLGFPLPLGISGSQVRLKDGRMFIFAKKMHPHITEIQKQTALYRKLLSFDGAPPKMQVFQSIEAIPLEQLQNVDYNGLDSITPFPEAFSS